MSHTPGPWVCDSEKDMFDTDERTWTVTAADGTFLADGIPWDRESDARLIAAAPELLAALKLLRNPGGDGKWPCYCDDPHYEGGMCENCVATAAITKAEGRIE